MVSYGPHNALHWILIATASGVFILFGLALQHFFVQAREPSRTLRFAQDASVLVAMLQVLGVVALHPPTGAHAGAGIAIYSAALSIFLSSIEACRRLPLPRAFVIDPRPSGLVTTGPFGWVRHPFYVAYWLAFLAAPVATASAVLAAPALVYGFVFTVAARREETRLLAGEMGAQYREYTRTHGHVRAVRRAAATLTGRGLVRGRRQSDHARAPSPPIISPQEARHDTARDDGCTAVHSVPDPGRGRAGLGVLRGAHLDGGARQDRRRHHDDHSRDGRDRTERSAHGARQAQFHHPSHRGRDREAAGQHARGAGRGLRSRGQPRSPKRSHALPGRHHVAATALRHAARVPRSAASA